MQFSTSFLAVYIALTAVSATQAPEAQSVGGLSKREAEASPEARYIRQRGYYKRSDSAEGDEETLLEKREA
ncbi:hypothetical protein NEOLI_005512, partial [Neolecta irregularis DAH-3]